MKEKYTSQIPEPHRPKNRKAALGLAATIAVGGATGAGGVVGYELGQHHAAKAPATVERPIRVYNSHEDMLAGINDTATSYAHRILALSEQSTPDAASISFSVENDGSRTLGYTVTADTVVGSGGAYSFRINAAPNATGDSIDPSKVNEITMTSSISAGPTASEPLYEFDLQKKDGTNEWIMTQNFADKGGDMTQLSYATAPNLGGSTVFDAVSLERSFQSPDALLLSAEQAQPVGYVPQPAAK